MVVSSTRWDVITPAWVGQESQVRVTRSTMEGGPSGHPGSSHLDEEVVVAEQSEAVRKTDDGRFVVISGRRWRATDPEIPEDVAAVLRTALMAARRDVGRALRSGDDPAAARARVQIAKVALGERGTPWWEQTPDQRRRRWEHGLAELDGQAP